VLASLSGCAYVQTDVRVSGVPGQPEAGRTYQLARTLPQGADPAQSQYETRVRNALAGYGWVEASPDAVPPPYYRVSIAYDTHPVSVGIEAGDCRSAGPGAAGSSNGSGSGNDSGPPGCAPLEAQPVEGRGQYVHSFTLRVFDGTVGREIYKVTTVERDDEKDAANATPYLVKSALAKLPFASHPGWRVKLRKTGTDGEPEVISVGPLTNAP
jgi:hypothetical protein